MRRIFRNLDYISIILLIFGFLLSIIGFWNLETILWNRIKYTTGSQWENANPIYLNTPLSQLVELLNNNIIFYILGNFIVLIIIITVIYQYLFKKSWYNTSKILLFLLLLCSFFNVIIGFWQRESINVIENLPAYGGTISGYEWIRADLNFQSTILELFSFLFIILPFIPIIITMYIIIKHRILARRNEESLDIEVMNGGEIVLNRKDNNTKKPLKKSSEEKFVRNIPLYIILVIYLIFTIFPVFLTAIASVSTPYEINNALPPSNPIRSLILNYSSVMFSISVDESSFINSLGNSLFIGFGTSLLGLALSVTSAYALARSKFRGKTILTFIILATQMFPGIILLIPQYVIMSQLGLLEDNVVLIGYLFVMATGSTAYVTWMMKGYFETIPTDIEEAAYIDGYGKLSTFIRIVLPLAKSGMVAVMVFTFLSAWQEFVLARTFIGIGNPRATLPLLFYNYQNLNAPDNPTFYELLSPYSILVATPVVVFYLVLQRQLTSGALAGGIK